MLPLMEVHISIKDSVFNTAITYVIKLLFKH